MSQEKVELKKAQKQNVRKNLKKKKIEHVIATVCTSIVCIAIVAWIGYSVYTKAAAYAEENKTYVYNEISSEGISDYVSELNSEDAE